MAKLTAKDIMHPRMSVPAKESGDGVVKRLMGYYTALPVVTDDMEVIGTVSEVDILDAVREGRTIHEFSAESIMSCGHAEHKQSVCKKPITINPNVSINEIVDLMYKNDLSILPVVDGKKLVGMISRKDLMVAMAEKGFWPEEDFKKRV
jgi:CIC family chloride channel protein